LQFDLEVHDINFGKTNLPKVSNIKSLQIVSTGQVALECDFEYVGVKDNEAYLDINAANGRVITARIRHIKARVRSDFDLRVRTRV
jgi:hypothetical protein